MLRSTPLCNFGHLLFAVVLAACTTGETESLTLSVQGTRVIAAGVVTETTPEEFNALKKRNTALTTLVLRSVPGSDDDVANLTLARTVRKLNLTTIVPSDGLVASGGTDLFLAGSQRNVEAGACIGVHSWASSGLFGTTAGVNLPRENPEHRRYLQFYSDMGIDAAFYWFTLNAAGVDDVHWMTEEEINAFGLSTSPMSAANSDTPSERNERCNARLADD